MVRQNDTSESPKMGPRFSLLPNETAEDAIACTLEWLQEVVKTPEGLEQAYKHISATIQERDQALGQIQTQETQIRELIAERDEFQYELLQALRQQATSRESTPQTQTAPAKSTKIPDPPMLIDGKSPSFESWLTKIQNKLKVNADHFLTEDAKIAYIQLRTDGEASEHIQPRLQDDAPDQYTTAEELLSHLQSIYEDPNRVFNAKNEFKKLFMKPSQTFHEFYTRFLHLSGRARIAQSELKYELNNKLSFNLQKQVIVQFHDDNISLKSFAAQCGVIDQSLKAINERQNKGQSSTARTTPAQTSATLTTPAATPSPATSSRHSRLSDNERQELIKANKCFYCKKEGHRATDCPVKKHMASINKIEEVEEDGQGKASP